MAFTKVVSASLSVNGPLGGACAASLSETSSGTDFQFRPVTVTTSWVAIPLGGLASFDVIAAFNTDITNYVQVAFANDGSLLVCRLTPAASAGGQGTPMLFKPEPGQTLYWKANSGNCVCNLGAVEP